MPKRTARRIPLSTSGRCFILAAGMLACGPGLSGCAQSASASEQPQTQEITVFNRSSVEMHAGVCPASSRPSGMQGLTPQTVRPNGSLPITVPANGWIVLAQSRESGPGMTWERRISADVTAIEATMDPKKGRISARAVRN